MLIVYVARFLRERWRYVLVALAALSLAGGLARCRHAPARVEQHQEVAAVQTQQTSSTQQTASDTVIHRAPVVVERFSAHGTVTERTTVGEVDVSTQEHTEAQAAGTERLVEHVVTQTVTEPPRPPRLGVSVDAQWDALRIRPSSVSVAVDVPVGSLLGLRLRAGPSVRFSSSLVPDAYGVALRAELP